MKDRPLFDTEILIEKRVDRAIWIGFVVVILTGMATGNGLASFEHQMLGDSK